MRGAVIFQDHWMIHRNVRSTLLKVGYWIATRGHHVSQQLVRFRYCPGRCINKPRLHLAPRFYEARVIGWREWPDVETFDSFFALFEPGFRMPPAATFFQRAVILGASEPRAQSCRPALS